MEVGQFGVHGLCAQKAVRRVFKIEPDPVPIRILLMGETIALEMTENLNFATLKSVQVRNFIHNRFFCNFS